MGSVKECLKMTKSKKWHKKIEEKAKNTVATICFEMQLFCQTSAVYVV